MNNNFKWDAFLKGRIAVHCVSKEESDDFLKCAAANGITDLLASTKMDPWSIYESNTCYIYSLTNPHLTVSAVHHIHKHDISVLRWECNQPTTRPFSFKMIWEVSGRQTVAVPADLNEEEALEYVKSHWDKVPIPTEADYISGSDELDEESEYYFKEEV